MFTESQRIISNANHDAWNIPKVVKKLKKETALYVCVKFMTTDHFVKTLKIENTNTHYEKLLEHVAMKYKNFMTYL